MQPEDNDKKPPTQSGEVGASAPAVDAPAPAATPVTSNAKPAPHKRKGFQLAFVLLLAILVAAVIGALVAGKEPAKQQSASVQTVKSIPNLRVGTTQGPIGKDTIFPNATSVSTNQAIDFQIYEGLVGYRDKKIVPLLATSWTNPNKSTWVFKLAKNVKFQNGQTMTAADVKSSLDSNLANEDWNTYVSTISAVTVSGPNEVTITTTQPDSLLLNRLIYSFIFQKGPDGVDYGTGPYTVDTTKPLTESATTLKAYSGYHGGTPLTKSVTYTVYPDSDTMDKAFKAKQIDTFEDTTNTQLLSSLKQSNTATLSYDHLGSFGLRLNTVRPNAVLANPKLREAVAYALDRDDLVKKLTDTVKPTQTIVPKTVIGYDASATFPSLDIAKSKQLQAEAGYPNGAPLTFLFVQGTQPDPPILINQLTAAGFKVTSSGLAKPADVVAAAKAGSYDLFGSSNYTDYNDASDIFASILGSQQSVFSVYNNPKFDAMITAAAQEFDPAAHVKKVQDINKFVADNYLWIPLRTTSSTVYSVPSYQVTQNFNTTVNAVFFWQVGQVENSTK